MNNIEKKSDDLSRKHELFELLTGKKLIKPESRYNNWSGLRFSSEYVNAIGGAIAIFPLKTVAAFVPKYTKQRIDFNSVFVMKSMIERVKSTNFTLWKAEDLGGLAYIIQKCGNEEIKMSAFEMYELFKAYLENRILQVLEEIEKGRECIS